MERRVEHMMELAVERMERITENMECRVERMERQAERMERRADSIRTTLVGPHALHLQIETVCLNHSGSGTSSGTVWTQGGSSTCHHGADTYQ